MTWPCQSWHHWSACLRPNHHLLRSSQPRVECPNADINSVTQRQHGSFSTCQSRTPFNSTARLTLARSFTSNHSAVSLCCKLSLKFTHQPPNTPVPIEQGCGLSVNLGQGCDKGESAGIGYGDWCMVFPSGAAGTFLSRLISTGANRNQKATWPSSRALVSSLVCIGVRSGLPVCVYVCVCVRALARVSEDSSVSIRIDTQRPPSFFCSPPPRLPAPSHSLSPSHSRSPRQRYAYTYCVHRDTHQQPRGRG